MNTYEVSFKTFYGNVCTGRDSIIITANSSNEACKKASLKIKGPHAILFASLINCPVS